MKKSIILFGILSMVLFSLGAQDFQGVATYKTKRKLDFKIDSTKMDAEMYKNVKAMLKKQFEKTFLLAFNRESSVYKEDKPIEGAGSGGMQIEVMTTNDSEILYKNIKENRYTSQSEVLGKVFLVRDTLETQDWQLEKETKFIGQYACRKATRKRMVEVFESTVSIDGDNDFNEENSEPEMREVIVTAWYTMQIPINTGPDRYYGLPGLILEVHDGDETIVCSKIVLNPKDKVTIKEPSSGKKINQKDFDVIVEEKIREQEEKRNQIRDDDDGHSVEIRMGG
ncbi:GLPGLI family protein [Seonamhaeicola sp. MEBiC1930]|uniref:GLPGLI family protein n=1 Tax=Seonamhaeicola sp. MEBiC01930 TaxID=2976768 RepID=UPI00324A034E